MLLTKPLLRAFRAYGRLPSLYASQGFDTANLIISALEKADVKNAGHFVMLRAVDFESMRGDFSFASNQHPIQSIYARQVIQEGDVFTNKVLSMVWKITPTLT